MPYVDGYESASPARAKSAWRAAIASRSRPSAGMLIGAGKLPPERTAVKFLAAASPEPADNDAIAEARAATMTSTSLAVPRAFE